MNRTTKRMNTKPIHKPLFTAERKYFIIQKTIGIAAIVFGIAAGILIHDVAPLIACFIGAAFLFSKEKILMATNVYWEENPRINIENPSGMCYDRRR